MTSRKPSKPSEGQPAGPSRSRKRGGPRTPVSIRRAPRGGADELLGHPRMVVELREQPLVDGAVGEQVGGAQTEPDADDDRETLRGHPHPHGPASGPPDRLDGLRGEPVRLPIGRHGLADHQPDGLGPERDDAGTGWAERARAYSRLGSERLDRADRCRLGHLGPYRESGGPTGDRAQVVAHAVEQGRRGDQVVEGGRDRANRR